jgi:hypothetical protein
MYDSGAPGATIIARDPAAFRGKRPVGFIAKRRDLWLEPTLRELDTLQGRAFVLAVAELATYQPRGVERPVAGDSMIIPQGGFVVPVREIAIKAKITNKQARRQIGIAVRSGFITLHKLARAAKKGHARCLYVIVEWDRLFGPAAMQEAAQGTANSAATDTPDTTSAQDPYAQGTAEASRAVQNAKMGSAETAATVVDLAGYRHDHGAVGSADREKGHVIKNREEGTLLITESYTAPDGALASEQTDSGPQGTSVVIRETGQRAADLADQVLVTTGAHVSRERRKELAEGIAARLAGGGKAEDVLRIGRAVKARLESIRWVGRQADENRWALGNALNVVFSNDTFNEVLTRIDPNPSRQEAVERQRLALSRMYDGRSEDERLAALAASERAWAEAEAAYSVAA